MSTRPAFLARRLAPLLGACAALTLAACGSSATTSTAPSSLSRCGVTLGLPVSTLPAEGGNGRVTVTTERECVWSAASEASWLSITSAREGQGDGFVEFRAGVNGDPVARRGSLVFNTQRLDLVQSAAECDVTLREHSSAFPQAGGSGSVNVVSSSPMCTWIASADANWISIPTPAGKGTAAVGFAVAPTTGPPRVGTITVAGQRFSVTQSDGCSYSISPQGESFGREGGSGTIGVATAPGCPWVSGSNVPWAAITAGETGAGAGTVEFSVQPTDGAGRSGTLVIAGSVFSITQSPGCTFQVSPTAHNLDGGGGTRSVSVVAGSGCSWTASSGASWLSIVSGASGTGNGTVTFAVGPTSGSGRTGTLTVAGQTVTVSQGAGCSFAISPESQSVDISGGSGEVAVTAAAGCAWSAVSNVSWITITQGASGSGNGSVRFTVGATLGTRTGTLTIAGRTFTVTQAPACTVTLSPQETTVGSSGGTRTFNVESSSSCSWSASTDATWITIAQGRTGSGNGSVRVDVAANPGGARTGVVTVSGRTFTVRQDGSCSANLSAESTTIAAAGGSGSVSVTSTAGCGWTAASNAQWITVTAGLIGAGNGTVAFTVVSNTGPPRTGTLTIAGRTFTVNQAGLCLYSIAPQQQSVAAAGGNVNVAVTAAAGCAWTAASNASWIQVAQGGSGTGNGTVLLSIASSDSPARTGTATIAGQTFTVQQASGCTFGISPSSRNADASGGSNMFNVATTNECAWTAVSEVSWIVLVGASSHTGNGKVDYSVAANPGPARTGTIRVGTSVFTVMQSGR